MTNQTPVSFDKIAQALDLESLPVEEQEELLLELNSLIFKGTMMRLVEAMDEPTRDAWCTLVERDASEEEMQAFIQENVPNADVAVAEIVQELTNDILAVTK